MERSQPLIPLQSLLWPDPALCDDPELYARRAGDTAFAPPTDSPALRFGPGGQAQFDTYGNIFNMGKWQRHCALTHLALRLTGHGHITLHIIRLRPDTVGSVEDTLFQGPVDLSETPCIEISPPDGFGPDDLMYFAVTADSKGALSGAEWCSAQAPRRTPEMMLAITTFKREAAVQATVARFEAFMATSQIAAHLHLVVVDNGQTAQITPSPHVTPIANENLGGSGGFARGLLEAKARGASHCLFMDDDASVHMPALERTWAFLAYTTDDSLAIAGALANADESWRLWENGAVFDRSCRPAHIGMDLRHAGEVRRLEWDSAGPKPHNFYGGWWYFAFPVAATTHMPFPFFVRGDDISFSLVHDFTIVTLPGVICFQDQNFADKESLQTLYLDLRSHLAHHMAIPHMDIGRRATLRIAMWFFARSLFQCHYDTLAALNLSFDDFMKGPDFFEKNADMADRRATIATLRHSEIWQLSNAPVPAEKRWINPDHPWALKLMIFTLNGHLIPFFGLFGNRVVLEAGQRGQLHQIWGASDITYLDRDAGTRFTLRHSKWRAARQMLRFLRLSWQFWRRYDRLKRQWQAEYPDLTSTAFWAHRMGLDDTPHKIES
ncbi:MAG: glycosyltransferase [Rhodobacteraceae bacterium]|nr:glycosyltransferase [Paracoccaceae bacterium]